MELSPRNAERARIIAEAKRKNEASRQVRIADKHGVMDPDFEPVGASSEREQAERAQG